MIYLNCRLILPMTKGSAAYHYLAKEQENQKPPVLESTASFHFMSFFISGVLSSYVALRTSAQYILKKPACSLVWYHTLSAPNFVTLVQLPNLLLKQTVRRRLILGLRLFLLPRVLPLRPWPKGQYQISFLVWALQEQYMLR